ncbi:protein Wnt-4-like [Anoplophora glabripennis]|uniref:protein Wnt-4-like n=1 Tax=Anoplophora glabripennis TaxID=217634 RepID=UPI00087413B8|nr:protein Wnt-4-like [Anoplophora glabripennis]
MKISSTVNVTSLVVILFLYSLLNSNTGAELNKTTTKVSRRKSFVAVVFTSNFTTYNTTRSRKGLCRWLKHLKHQARLCAKRKGLAELLLETKKLTINSCKQQFQFEQWNCSNTKKFFKKVYRETAFMYSLTTSAFMYLVARACAEGKLSNCKCASHGKSDNSSKWQWGGCGDNTKFAKTFTNKIFQLKRKGDTPRNILKYDSEIGMQVVMESEEKKCKCHGLSGSCTMKICWKRLRPFELIAQELKNRYHGAIQVDSDNNIHIPQKEDDNQKLVYLEKSPNFCPLTVGRRCKNTDNCATLCCGRGFSTSLEKVKETCNCRWSNESLYQISCQQCEKEETVYVCQ